MRGAMALANELDRWSHSEAAKLTLQGVEKQIFLLESRLARGVDSQTNFRRNQDEGDAAGSSHGRKKIDRVAIESCFVVGCRKTCSKSYHARNRPGFRSEPDGRRDSVIT